MSKPTIDTSDQISLCRECWCMTKTIDGNCGKCKAPKDTSEGGEWLDKVIREVALMHDPKSERKAKEAINAHMINRSEAERREIEARIDELGYVIPNYDGVGSVGHYRPDAADISIDDRIEELEQLKEKTHE